MRKILHSAFGRLFNKNWLIATILTICGTAAFASCTANDDNPSGQAVESRYVPVAPDYSDPTMWITEDGDADGTGADVFYVVSTWEDDWTTADGKVCHYADVWNPEHRAHMADLKIMGSENVIILSGPSSKR